MASGPSANNVPQVNGNGQIHPLNPEARIFVPRQNFAVNNNTQKQTASATTTTAAATTTTAAATTTTARAAPAPTTARAAPAPPPTLPPPPHYFQYRAAPVVPVVYPSVHGTPGTIFFMPMYQVPPSAVLLPLENGNGAEMAFHYRIANYKKQKEPSSTEDSSTS